jgi:hypothetical protein
MESVGPLNRLTRLCAPCGSQGAGTFKAGTAEAQ